MEDNTQNAAPAASGKPADENRNIVVTVGRQFGSGGRELGRKLADRMGVKYYDKELLSEAAKRAGVSEEFFEKSDERFPKFLNGIFSFAFGMNPFNAYTGSTSISGDSLYQAQSDFIHQLARESSCVIVGRTSDYVLRDHPRRVNVFVHAPEEACIDRITRRETDETTREQARQQLRRTNQLRANYYNFYTDKTWGDAASYDLTFDTSLLPMDDIVELIVSYINRRFGEKF